MHNELPQKPQANAARRLSSDSKRKSSAEPRKSIERPSKPISVVKKSKKTTQLKDPIPSMDFSRGTLAEKLEAEVVRLTEALEGADEVKEIEKFQTEYSKQNIENLKNVMIKINTRKSKG